MAWDPLSKWLAWGRPRSLTLTPGAKAALIRDMTRITAFVPVASVLWAESATLGRGLTKSGELEHRGPHWSVGFYDLSKVSRWRLREIDGIRFTFLRQTASPRLDGATLDYEMDRYTVHERRGA